MTGLAALLKLFVMGGSVTGCAGFTRITPGFTGPVTGLTGLVSMSAPQGKIRLIVIERSTVKPGQFSVPALVFGMARAATARRNKGVPAMQPLTSIQVVPDFHVAIQTKTGLRGLVPGLVAVIAGSRLAGMHGTDLSGADQVEQTVGKTHGRHSE